jgi:hypothetical protein
MSTRMPSIEGTDRSSSKSCFIESGMRIWIIMQPSACKGGALETLSTVEIYGNVYKHFVGI